MNRTILKAILVQAILAACCGMLVINTGCPITPAADTNVWDFIGLLNENPNVTAWWMTYDGGTWSIEQMAQPPFGMEYRTLTVVTMDVVEAWDLVVAAGYQPSFQWWSVFKSLHPNAVNPNYVFPISGGFALVDTVTGEVTQE